MKLIIEVTEGYYKHLKDKKYNRKATVSDATILDGIPYEERLQGDLISSLTELCDGYCKNCPVAGKTNDCTDCICTHIRGIIERKQRDE